MKRLSMLAIFCLAMNIIFAQNDSTKTAKPDTVRIGNMIIIKKMGEPEGKTITMSRFPQVANQNISTSWWIFDLGFANFSDQTNYSAATTGQYVVNRPGAGNLGESDFKLRAGKSSNVNIWIFMQRLNVYKHYVNLKYGIGAEMVNYRFKTPVSFKESGPAPYTSGQNISHPFVFRDSISFEKNKLAASYLTVPFMININTNPKKPGRSLSFSAGMSVGYLYGSRNKQISDERGKLKNKSDYGLENWKISYVGELGLGPVRLFGSYSPNSIFEKGLDWKPYNFGLRLSNW